MKYLFKILFFFYWATYSQTVVWQNRLGGSSINICRASTSANDGGIVICGYSNSNASADKTENAKGEFDYWVLKVNDQGQVVWDKTLGGETIDVATKIIPTNDGNYLLIGYSNSIVSGDCTEASLNNSLDFWVLKITDAGTILWQNKIGGASNEEPIDCCTTNDGGYLIGGYSESAISGDKTESNRGFQDYWVVKIDGVGNVVWDKTYGGIGNDIISSICPLSDGNYLLSGFSNSPISGDKTENSRGNHDYWILKIDGSGNILWQKTIGGSNFDIAYCSFEYSPNSYWIGGNSNSSISGEKNENTRGFDDYWITVLDAQGNLTQQFTLGGSLTESLYEMIKTQDGNVLLSGSSNSPVSGEKSLPTIGQDSRNAWLLKIDQTGNIIWQQVYGGIWEEGFNSIVELPNGDLSFSGGATSPLSGTLTEGPIGQIDYWTLRLTETLGNLEHSEYDMTVFPNPTTSDVTIQWHPNGETVQFYLYSPLGQKIDEQSEITGNFRLTLPEASGIYFLKVVYNNKESKGYKIIKK